jgi:hypothetical protein
VFLSFVKRELSQAASQPGEEFLLVAALSLGGTRNGLNRRVEGRVWTKRFELVRKLGGKTESGCETSVDTPFVEVFLVHEWVVVSEKLRVIPDLGVSYRLPHAKPQEIRERERERERGWEMGLVVVMGNEMGMRELLDGEDLIMTQPSLLGLQAEGPNKRRKSKRKKRVVCVSEREREREGAE